MLAPDSQPAPPPSLNSFRTASHCLPRPAAPGPASSSVRPPAGLQPLPSARGRGPARRALPGPSRGTEPERGGRALGEGPACPGEPNAAGAGRCVLRWASGTPCPKSSPNAWSVGSGREHGVAQCALAGEPAVPVLHIYSSKETRNKTRQTHTPHQLRDVTLMCLLLDLDADRTSLQCRKSNPAIKGSICSFSIKIGKHNLWKMCFSTQKDISRLRKLPEEE